MNREYPEWAPQVLIDQLSKSKNKSSSFYKFKKRLITSQSMQSVWETIEKRNKNNSKKIPLDLEYKIFFTMIYTIRLSSHRDHKDWERLTIAERKKLKLKLEKLSNELNDCVALLPSLFLEPIKDMLPADMAYEYGVRVNENNKYLFDIGDNIPGVGRRLIKSALKELNNISNNIDPEYGLLKRPAKEKSDQLLFIRRLGIHCKNHFGTFLYEVIANTSSVAFNDPDIDKDLVRFALKGIDMETSIF